MERHGFELWLAKDRNGWRATFLHRSHVLYPWVGQVLHWWPTPWRAVQEAAWRALEVRGAEDGSISGESPTYPRSPRPAERRSHQGTTAHAGAAALIDDTLRYSVSSLTCSQ